MQLTIKGILSYPHLFTARRVDETSEPKYSVNLLLHASDPQLAQVRQAIETEKHNGFPNGFPSSGKLCLKESETNPGYWEVRTSTGADSKPAVVDMNRTPVLDPGSVTAGDEAWVAFNTYPYNKPMSKGIAAGLNAVMVTGKLGALGRLDNRASVDQLFAGIGGDAPATDFMGGAPTTMVPPPPAPMAPPPAPPAPPMAPPPPPPAPPVVEQFNVQGTIYTRAQLQGFGWTDDQINAAPRA